MADQYVAIAPDSTGKKVDCSELTVSSQTVERQRIVLADPTSATGLAPVSATLGLSVTQQAAGATTVTMQNAAAATGNGTVITVTGEAALVMTVSGTFVGTITFEGTQDSTNYSSLNVCQLGTSTIGSTATAPGLFECSVAGLTSVRARISAYTSGSITVTGQTVPVSFAPRSVNARLTAPTLNVGQPSIGTSATVIVNANPNRTRLLITNTGTTDVYIGGSGVSTTNGHKLKGIDGYPVVLRFTGAVYGIVASGSQTVTYAEETN